MMTWKRRLILSIIAGLVCLPLSAMSFASIAAVSDSIPAPAAVEVPEPLPEVGVVNANDPYEPFNRVMYNFNDFIDRALLKPAAILYNKIVPKPIVRGISNIFSNIDGVTTVANDVLQFNFYQAVSDSWRVVINSTVGVAGFFDVAQAIGLEENTEDFGLTLAQWGWKTSNYLVLPFIGPSSVRDGLAWPINYELLSVYPYIYPIRLRYVLYGTNIVSKRAQLLRFQDVMQQAAIDKYVFLRNAYLQTRAYRIERNKQLGDPYLEKSPVSAKTPA